MYASLGCDLYSVTYVANGCLVTTSTFFGLRLDLSRCFLAQNTSSQILWDFPVEDSDVLTLGVLYHVYILGTIFRNFLSNLTKRSPT